MTRLALAALLFLGCGPTPVADEDLGVVEGPDAGDGGGDVGETDAGPDDGGAPRRMVDFVAALADPLAPARRLPGSVFLRSSRTPEAAAGNTNSDLDHFVDETEERFVLADEEGPGVITRLWFTFGGTGDDSVADRVRAFIVIDGELLALEGESDDEPGILLGDLTSGELEGFPAPWVLGRDDASGGLLVQLPIHYRESFRLMLDRESTEEAWVYYQVDGRTMPDDVTVPAFDPTALEVAVAAANARWSDPDGAPGELQVAEPEMLAAGESRTLELTGAGAITDLRIDAPRGTRNSMNLRIAVDGSTAIDAPLAWATGASDPAEAFESLLIGAADDHVRFSYPVPFDESVTIEVVADVSAQVGIQARVLAMEESPDESLGHLFTSCGEARVDIDESICSQNPDVQYDNVVVAELSGPGQYAGQSFYVDTPGSWWWMLEADHEVYVDGEYPMLGTGTEDYFGGAFYFSNGPFASPFVGAPGWVREGRAMTIHMFRHHLIDTIPFEEELRFEYESYIDQTVWSGCAFAYRFEP